MRELGHGFAQGCRCFPLPERLKMAEPPLNSWRSFASRWRTERSSTRLIPEQLCIIVFPELPEQIGPKNKNPTYQFFWRWALLLLGLC